MALRIRLKVSAGNRLVITSALVNTGFETEKPQLMIPISLAKELGLWPPPPDTDIIELGTAGGPVRKYLLPNALKVLALEDDRVVGPVDCDAIISPIEEEVLINDKLGGALGIVILDIAEGLWRFKDEGEDVVRKSYSPQYWTA